MSVWAELKRRNVFKVGAAYAVLGWLILQVANNLFPPLGLPPWTQTLVAALLLLGFPFALLLAWVYEITPEGIKRTSEVPREQSVSHVTSHRLNYVVTGLLVLAVASIALDAYVLRPDRAASLQSTAAASAPPTSAPSAGGATGADAGAPADTRLPNSVAVLPFDNLSTDPDHSYFAVGIHDEILNQLAKVGSLNVISRTSVLQYRSDRPPIPEIARALNVGAVMEGSVRYAGNRIQVTVQLIDATTDSHMWSETYPGDVSDLDAIFALQADIAMNVANALRAELTPAELASIEEPPTNSPEAYEAYLEAVEASLPFTLEGFERALELIDSALEHDPNFALAWAQKSGIHSGISTVAALERVAPEQDASEQAALRAIALAPDLGDAYAALGFISAQRGKLIEAETAYRRAGDLGAPNLADTGFGTLSMGVANFARACEGREEVRDLDPLNSNNRAFLVSCFGLNGDMGAAVAEHARGRALYGAWPLGDEHLMRLRLGVGDTAAAMELASASAIDAAARDNLDSPSEALAALRALRANAQQPALRRIAMWTAYFGDSEQTLEVMQSLVAVAKMNAYLFWYPQMAGVRRLPAFKTLMREAGFVEYWDRFGWPAACRRTSGDDFECE